ncbi:trifunctional serine/threonine-protein kinase/ATP-binding protein/sensor histidine kinase [Vitiosangium sp. GDMCC 1.1324]|uniref:trifunctional serine/threonine-protein kinase/ATP-binding protein/sensor histidine kinase n=1 Tax=Vitiosangium sp. (strain GDMCC 1.1324) TaxID=2138576 RepID=UPI000D3D46F2|nr:trifunctional serine/threonine-protein kinase/ATP-binding protein/sensor histidine kinase [Vitiosangium sp. GDMCC 1.1324]PTL76364.1 histidine kinase [Vitiosangium sp. GDMCC 1.1324]
MLNIPGYTLHGAIKTTGTNLLFHAVRDSDGLRLVVKTPMASAPVPREIERYRREFAILQRLQDVPGVTRVHTCERLLERPMLLMEEVEGEPLSELTGRPLDVARVLDLGISLASTLAEIHRRGVIHKDIKPSNIIVTPTGETRLIDFGTATLQLVEHVDASPVPLIEGTLAYMSPEQTGRMNRSVDYRTDLYSLGVTLYELLTGSRPFQGRDALEWFHAHMAVAPQPPLKLVPGLPPVLSAIVLRLLAKVAEERYQSADGLRADLEQCRDGLRRGTHEEFLLGVHDYPTHFQLPQRLYGRDSQAAALLQGFERVGKSGRPELILVGGYSGIGKSSVVHELHKPVVRQRGFFLTGKFDQFQRDIPYATVAQALRGLTQQLLAGSDEELTHWRKRLSEAWEGQGQVLVDVVPQLELVAGKQPPVQEVPPSESQHRFNRVFRQFLGVFATAEHPLVLFLDDLQWVDLASLQLLQHLLTHPEAPPILLLGAYRDNEVSPSHPLMQMMEGLFKSGAKVTALQLEPLSLEEVRQLVTDTLPGADEEIVEPLSVLVREKTGGNPFFLLQFMQTLNQDGLLVRTPQGAWRWDEQGVQAKGYSDNVVDFMAGKLRQLPLETQHLLRLAACVGSFFSLQILGVISNLTQPSQVEKGLEPALQEGLLVRAGPEQYRFLHDRIQQAAYAFIPEKERNAVHLHIGRLLLASLSPEEVQEKLFDVVSHLNAGMELLDEPEERLRVARLNAEAGRKAKASTAFRSAAGYLETAFQFLPGDPWETDRELAFKLRLDRATCEFMTGNAPVARDLVEELLPRARTRPEMAAAYRLKSVILTASSQIHASCACLVECLTQMGIPMSVDPTWEEVETANAEVWALMGERSIESLLELPLMADPDMEAVMSVLGSLFAPAYFTNTRLLILQLCRTIALSIRHGNVPSAAHGYAWYGVVLGSAFKRYREGYAFGRLACDLVERYDLAPLRGKVLYIMEVINNWTHPLTVSLDLVRRGFQHAVQASDFQIAAFCSNHIVTMRLELGHNLEAVYQESVARLAFVRKAGFQDVQHVIHHIQRYVQQLRGLSPTFGSLNGEDFDEATFETVTMTPNRMSTMRCWYWLLKMQARFLCGAYAEAREAADKAAELTWSSLGLIQLLDFHLFRALTLAGGFRQLPPEEQPRALETIREHQRQLAEWASHCPSTFRAPERMVSAELARLMDQEAEALRAYEAAQQSAREHGFIQFTALANELAARFWLERQVPTLAETYARRARDAWKRWGAEGKVRHLDAQWPHLASSTSADGTSTDTTSTQLDALTVVKAQQAISGEIVLERLATTLLRAAIENAGAQRGALLLPQGDKLQVVACSSTSPEDTALVAGEDCVPATLITYVKRTREHVLIGDASQPHPFSSDAWFERGGARSVLCLPLLRHEEFRGVLYLENCLTTNAFTPARIALLGHLASQAAISIENARLYDEVQRAETALRHANDELEKRVEERTRELKQAQARLVDTARAAGMAEVATNVLHNVGNVLTSAVINLQTLRETLSVSRLGRLKQVSALLEEHRDHLADFLTRDRRGTALPTYISALSQELFREQDALKEGMGAMSKHIEHIRAIVQVQQNYAHNTLLAEECDLLHLVEDALSIQRHTLQRHGITVTRELHHLSRVKLDKHKVLQILVNLISNAKNAMQTQPEGQRCMHVRLATEGNTAHIQVVDNGRGFAPDIRERLFTQGFTTREGGHGLGLHSSALAAKMLGGRVTLESAGPGQGATATLELPLT